MTLHFKRLNMHVAKFSLCVIFHLFSSAKNVEELARDLSLNSLLNLTRDAGLTDLLRRDDEFTLFAPTDEAFDGKFHDCFLFNS